MTVSYGQFAARSHCVFLTCGLWTRFYSLTSRSSSTGGEKVAGVAIVSIKETAEVLFEVTALLIDRVVEAYVNKTGRACQRERETGG